MKRNENKGWIVPHFKAQFWRFMIAALFGTLAAAFAGALLFTSGFLISRSSMQPENILMVYVPIVLVRTFGFGKAALQYVYRLIGHDVVLRILANMRIRLYQFIEPQAIYVRSWFRAGDLLAMLAEDIEQLQHVYLRIVLPTIASIVIFCAGIAFLGWFDVPFAILIALYCGFLLFGIPFVTLLRSRKQRKQHAEAKHESYQSLTDAVYGMTDWTLSGRTEDLFQRFSIEQTRMTTPEKEVRRKEWNMRWLSQVAIGGVVILMAIRASKWVQSGWIQPEWIAAFTLIVFPLLEGFTGTGEAIVEAPDYRASIDRLKQTEKMGIGEGGQTHVLSPAHRIDHRDADDAPWQQGGRLSLDRVSFRYSKDEELAVDNVSLTIPSGMKMAIIGQSGSGKSTLFKLIQGELPVNSGGITLDGHSTFEITQQHESIPVFSVLNQQPYLFDTTIENNIRLAHPEATEQEVQSAVEMAGLGELVAGLPKGLRTRVHESGLRFSGGERQRIALARILLQNTPIVLLDEPTVGLDPIVENRLIDTIFTALRGKTLIWITHHLRFLERMDQIVFFENGRVLMQGSHDQLMRSNNRYRQLYELDM